MNWKGELLPCGMMVEPKIKLIEHNFKEAWKYIVETTHFVDYCGDCVECPLQNICHVCPANLIAEGGNADQRPEYICRYTKELVRQMVDVMPDEWKEQNQILLSEVNYK